MGKNRIDLMGKRFGRLVVKSFGGTNKYKAALWNCVCDCGKEKTIQSSCLTRDGGTKSCGCISIEMRRDDLVGRKFGRWLVVGYSHTKNGRAYWNCVCECGGSKLVNTGDLNSGDSTSCGCFKIENAKVLYTKHGRRDTPEFDAWVHLRQRCYNKNDSAYKNYGKKGIIVCDEWLDEERGFINFYNHIGDRPSPIHSVDRYPNKYGNYEPGNVRWATPKQQANNKTNNVIFEFNGVKGTISQICDLVELDQSYVRLRLRRGWALEKALTIPKRQWPSQLYQK